MHRDISRMDAPCGGVLHDTTDSGSIPSGPICYQNQPSATEVHRLETRPICTGNRCLQVGLEGNGRICFPSLLPDREVHTENSQGTEYHHNGNAIVAISGLVSSATGNSGGFSITSAQSQGLIKRCAQSDASTNVSRSLRLVTCRVSGDNTQQREFQRKLQSCYWQDGVRELMQPINPDGKGGVTGVANGKLILFHLAASNHF